MLRSGTRTLCWLVLDALVFAAQTTAGSAQPTSTIFFCENPPNHQQKQYCADALAKCHSLFEINISRRFHIIYGLQSYVGTDDLQTVLDCMLAAGFVDGVHFSYENDARVHKAEGSEKAAAHTDAVRQDVSGSPASGFPMASADAQEGQQPPSWQRRSARYTARPSKTWRDLKVAAAKAAAAEKLSRSLASVAFEQRGAQQSQPDNHRRLAERNATASPDELRDEFQERQILEPAQWGLDRTDQHYLPLDKLYIFGGLEGSGRGSGATIYIVDSGIFTQHQEFRYWDERGGFRATMPVAFVADEQTRNLQDCDGHGTHIAATAVGLGVGVAKNASVVGVRVLECNGTGSVSNTVAGLDWVLENARLPAVATLSLGVVEGESSRSLAAAAQRLTEAGILMVVASGNSRIDACSLVPANVPEVITVSASDLSTTWSEQDASTFDSTYRWTNSGKCVDVFAPGVDIFSACGGEGRCPEVTDHAYAWATGTSMAVPFVAGVAAIYAGDNPTARPAEIKSAIIEAATVDVIQDPYLLEGTPNRLLYSRLQAPASDSVVLQASGP